MACQEDNVDVLDLLIQQHKEAKALFKKLEKAEGSEALSLWRELRDALTLHES